MEKKEVLMGHIKKLHLNLKGVMENFELDAQKSMNLYVGANGTGKTLVLIFHWLLGSIGAIYLASGKSMQEYEKILQFFFDHSFEKNNFTGSMGGVFENLEISFDLDNGKVSNLDIIIPDPTIQVIPNGMPIFMSKNTRLFSDIDRYLKTKRMIGFKGEITLNTDEDLKKLCEFYKIYDILFIERMIFRLKSGLKIQEAAKKSFVETMSKEITNVTYDEEKNVINIHEMKDGVEKIYPATMLSAGEQSWVNMFIQN